MISEATAAAYSGRPFRVLGTCWVAYGIIELIAAVWLISVRNTVTLMFGALLSRVPDPFTVMELFHLFYSAVILLTAISAVFGILAGWALLTRLRSARIVALIAAVLSLPRVPLGTILGVVSLIMLLPLTSWYAMTARLDDRALSWGDAAKAR